MPEDTGKQAPNYRIRILTPNVGPENIEALKANKPFLMRGEIERGARFLQVVSMPSLVDLLGFSGGGGAPAYGFLVSQAQVGRESALFISLAPNMPFYLPSMGKGCVGTGQVSWKPLGITQAMGALLSHFMLTGPGIQQVVDNAESEGAIVVDMIDYEIPELLQQQILPQRLQQMQGGK